MVFKGYQKDHVIQTRNIHMEIYVLILKTYFFVFNFYIICEMHDISKNMLLCETSDIPLINKGMYLTMTGRLRMIDASNQMCQYVKYVVRSITKKTISTTLLRRSNELDQYFHSNLFVP